MYDLLGEGPITLVDGLASIYLDKTPIANPSTISLVQARAFSGPINSGVFTFDAGDSPYILDEERPVLIQGGAKTTTGSTTANSSTVTVTGAGFFTTSMVASQTDATSGLYQKIRIKNAGPIAGTDYEGEITEVISGTSAKVFPVPTRTVSSETVTFDHFTYGTLGVSGGFHTLTLAVAPPVSLSSYNVVIGEDRSSAGYNYNTGLNFKNVRVSYRSGTINQTPVVNMPGYTNASSGKGFGTEIKQHTDFWLPVGDGNAPGGPAGLTVKERDMRILGLGAYNYGDPSSATIEVVSGLDLPVEADRVVLTIQCPNGLISSKTGTDDTVSTGVTFQIFFDYKSNTAAPWTTVQVYGPTYQEWKSSPKFWANEANPYFNPSGSIYGRTTETIDFEFNIGIDQYKPFSDYRFRIKRLTPTNANWGKWKMTNTTNFKAAQAFIDDKLSYPYSAYCALMLDADEHEGKPPQRAYRVRGIRCQVPSNYITREEASDGIAKYNRNVTTGAVENSYQNWDGNFRNNVYCNNPVWVLRSLLLDKRFGLGNWLSADNINKFSFYSLARRCDELVSDGEGGLEPRFVCGVYITEATEAYSIIKDFCSIMFSLPFWIDGKLLLEADRPKEPIYTFTKGNIIDGLFSYEYVGVKARPNQIAVSFNDSKNFYERSVELVDDVEGMISSGRVITEDAVAFGAVTRSQAVRYAKWKLLTAKYNTEVISFKTGENAGMLKPGDVIRVQDADKKRVRHSGRIKSSTTTQVVLDKPVTLSGAYTYKMHAMVEGDAIYLAQPEATIVTVTSPLTTQSFKAGDILPTSLPQFTGSTNGLTNAYNEETSVRLVDSSGNPIKTVWAPNIHIETRTVTNSASTTDTINVDAAFSIAPKNDFIWALSVEQSNVAVDTGGNLYRIMGIAEESIGTYTISAGLHLNEKFEELDELYLVTTPGRIDYTEEVPNITNFSASISYRNAGANASATSTKAIDIVLKWTPPQTSGPGSTSATYPNLSKYKIDHINPSGETNIMHISSSASNYTITDVSTGYHEFIIRAEGLAKNISAPAMTSIRVTSDTDIPATIKQAGKLVRGGLFTVAPRIEGKLIKTSDYYTFTSPSGITVNIVDGDLV